MTSEEKKDNKKPFKGVTSLIYLRILSLIYLILLLTCDMIRLKLSGLPICLTICWKMP